MHLHSKNEERAVNLSFLNVSGPGVFFRVESNEAAGSTPGGALCRFSQVSACNHTLPQLTNIDFSEGAEGVMKQTIGMVYG